MQIIKLQHVDGQAVSIVVNHVAAVLITTHISANGPVPCTAVHFGTGFFIPVIESREEIIAAMISAPHQ